MRHPTKLKKPIIKVQTEDFTTGPVVKTLPSNSGGTGLISGPQTQVHRVSDAIQPSRPLSSTSPPAPNPSQHQSLFQ